jgi:hypothetical protein
LCRWTGRLCGSTRCGRARKRNVEIALRATLIAINRYQCHPRFTLIRHAMQPTHDEGVRVQCAVRARVS